MKRMKKRLLEILENQEEDRKRKEKITMVATLFILSPLVIIAIFIFLAVIS